ncbi:MAG: hypothetical protein AAGF46_03455 [Pseudomonadota bacterium]
MDCAEAREIISCLPQGYTPFWYFRDRYALLLVSMLGDPISKRDIEASPCTRLLDKTAVKTVLGRHGGKAVPRDAFVLTADASTLVYSLTLDTWGSDRARWVQTTRRGFSLVLQLNFPKEHDNIYRRLIDPEGKLPFVYDDHPVKTRRENTLAWSRMDIDLASGEALIEEIQSDWIRYAIWMRNRAQQARVGVQRRGVQIRKEDLFQYCQHELVKYERWEETMLAATLWFLIQELGVRRIFYHTHDSGAALKRTGRRKPPRSLYTKLPARFCFRASDQRPAFMQGGIRTNCGKKAVARSRFQLLEL